MWSRAYEVGEAPFRFDREARKRGGWKDIKALSSGSCSGGRRGESLVSGQEGRGKFRC